MGYPETLEVLARLHVDPRFRRPSCRTRRRPGAVRADAARARGAGGRGRECAWSGRGGCWTATACRACTSTCRGRTPRCGPSLLPVLRDFLPDVLPELLNREEAIAFCRYLEAAPRGTLPPYVADLARCERLRSPSRGAWSPWPGPPTWSPSSTR